MAMKEHEVSTKAHNGTVVEIENILLKNLDIPGIIRHVERHIAHWPDATVVVNNHECEFSEPDINREVRVATTGTEYATLLGDVSLTIKVAKAPLEDELRGIAILSGGVWHETTLAGCERKPFAEYLFGALDVPALAQDKSGVSAFDMSRSMKLNPRNEVVADILRFVGVNLERIRKELEKQDRERRQSEDQKKLERQASKIAELINKHFKEWSSKLKNTMARAGTGRDILPASDEAPDKVAGTVFGNELPAILTGFGNGEGNPSPDPAAPDPKSLAPKVKLVDDAPEKLAKKDSSAPKKRVAGGFHVAFEKIGANEKRAKYDRDMRTIFINLEHPRIAMELQNSSARVAVDDPNFLRMAYEIAFTECAIVLAQELSQIQWYMDPQDALVDLRQHIDELSKAFAAMWPEASPIDASWWTTSKTTSGCST